MTQLQAAFDLLGVPPGSDAATVKAAWRALVRSYHPDMAKTDPKQANRRLAEINAAFDAVSANLRIDRTRRRAEAMERVRQMAKAAERARLEALAHREAVQQAAARAALTEAAQSRLRAEPRAAAAEKGGVRTGTNGNQPARPAPPHDAGEVRAPSLLAQRAAAAFRVVQQACSRDRKAEPRSVYL